MPRKPARATNPKPPSLTLSDFRVTGPKRSGEVEISAWVTINGKPRRLAIQAERPLLDALGVLSARENQANTPLYELISFYRQERFNASVQKTTGDHTPFTKEAWTTARVLFPLLLEWASTPGWANTGHYKAVVEALRGEGHANVTHAHIAAYVVRKNIENRRGRWPGKDPCINPDGFQRQLNKKAPLWNGVFFTSASKAYAALYPSSAKGKSLGATDLSRARLPLFVDAVLEGDSLVMCYQAGTISQTSF